MAPRQDFSVQVDQSGETVSLDTNTSVERLVYRINDRPPILILVSSALQHIFLVIPGALTCSSIVADVACVPFDHFIRAKLFCGTLFMCGFSTILQTAFGVRLPIFQGSSSSFIVPLLALGLSPEGSCKPVEVVTDGNNTASTNVTTDEGLEEVDEARMYHRLQMMSGALIFSSIAEVVVGGFGIFRVLSKFIGPITIATTISLIGVSLIKLPIIYGRPQYGVAFGCMILILIFILHMQNIRIPLPKCQKEGKEKPQKYFAIFKLLPIITAVAIMWILTWILTVCGVFTDDKSDPQFMARADAKIDLINTTPWFQLSYPEMFGYPRRNWALATSFLVVMFASMVESVGDYYATHKVCQVAPLTHEAISRGMFGYPRRNLALTTSFLVAVFASMVESVGDYYATHKVCQVAPPTHEAISRGIFMEGVASVISGAMGVGHATTSYSGNISVLTLTQTASRRVMYTAGIILIAASLIGKLGAAMTTIPNPILGGISVIIVGSLVSIGLANLTRVDMKSTRNMLVVGVSLGSGLLMPQVVTTYPAVFQTGRGEIDQMIHVLLGTPMFVGAVVAMVLDNTTPGSRKSRGFPDAEENAADAVCSDQFLERDGLELYSWTCYRGLIKRLPFLRYIPFLPK